ncbi:non-ribosomal peptide synthetase [Vibrio spartinae]|uniref:Tyrocidine synthase 3 n=1 Tax=Vibrio spartinae TaxID=1918945 RepID=A0A1N6MB05_9VIBR|nr:non-ribosomal peptide synthetase [Vibrio spartinae]SIO96604.1 Tyrocidine synthase 3 [Vibrio spartinae]
MAKPEGHKDPDYLISLMTTQGVTIVHFVPPMLQSFLEVVRPDDCPSLRLVFCSGEALPAEAIRKSYARLPQIELHNLYGPTEAAVDVTAWHCPRQLAGDRVSIGRPVANTQMYVLDSDGHPVPVGVEGELYIGGVQVARGYLNRDELTAERFVANPYASDESAHPVMYRTGDVGCWLADGTIEYRGRNDDQVKIRGFRIELGEISSALQSCAGVQDGVVVARSFGGRTENQSTENQSAEKQLVGYYTAIDTHAVPDVATLKAELTARLPAHMVPAVYVVIDTMPLTPNGKVNRKALPEPDVSAMVRHEYQAPVGDAETQLAAIWSELLGVDQVGRADNFFELGGHSLLAVRMADRLRQRGYQLVIRHLFSRITLAELAETLEIQDVSPESEIPPNRIPAHCQHITPEMLPLVTLDQKAIDVISQTVEGGSANIQDIYPLAPLQEGILFHHVLEQQGDPYVTRVVQSFKHEADIDTFISALQHVVQRHDILRTAVVWDGVDIPVQVVWREAPVVLHTLQATQLHSADSGDEKHSERVADRLCHHFDPAHTRMDIQRAPMIEAYKVADPAEGRWLLCFLLHHLCNDHTTLELLIEEVQAYITGREASLPRPLPFRNFVAQTTLNANQDEHLHYFRELLGDIDEPCDPFGLQASGDDAHVEATHVAIADDVAQKIRELSRHFSISPAALFHLAWGVVVQRATGQDDVVFGTVLFGRMAGGEGADRVLGMFLNTLPLRLSFADVSVESVLIQTQQRLAELLEHEHTSLALAQQCSGLSNHTPLFSSLLNYRYQGGSAQTDSADQEVLGSLEIAAENTNYPLTVAVNDIVTGGFSLDIHVNPHLSGERLGAMFITALTGLVSTLSAQPSAPVNQLTIVADCERDLVLNQFNQTQTAFPDQSCLHTLIEAQVARTPEATAVVFADQSLSYAELNAQANQLAHWLIEQGVRPDSRVAVCLERSCELVVSLLAILKAGGAYVPLDPGYPSERLTYMLSDSAPVALLTSGHLVECLGAIPATTRLVDLTSPVQPWVDSPQTNPVVAALTNRHLAYIIYTSGSTGLPKGVMNEHRGVVNRLHWMQHDYGFGPDDVVLQKTPFSFDVSVWEFFCPLWSGATLLMAKPEGHKDPDYLISLMTTQGVTIVHFVPPMLQSFLEVVRPDDCPSLRLVFCSGEALPAEAIRKSYARLPQIELHNLYGPTEAAVDVTAWHCPRQLAGDRVSIGRPVANTQMYVLDSDGHPVPVGVEGELYIGGVQVARGYLNRDELTAERFVANPYASDESAHPVMYRTGDVGCWLADGTIEYRGRNDDQVKIRGFRIELGEISSALQSCAGVQDGVVVARSFGGRTENQSTENQSAENQSAEKQLVGYYTAVDTHAVPDVATLKAELTARLPAHMVPAVYVVIDTMPLTPNGKVNRKALPEPDISAMVRHEYQAPVGDAETQLAEIWSALLGVEQVGRADNFFELGGHSLLAVRMVSEAQRQGMTLDLARLMTTPVLHELAATFGQTQDAATQITASAVQHDQVIPFRTTGKQLPLFIVPEFSGELLYGPALTANIDSDVPVYGLSAPDRMQTSLKTYQRMAERYVSMIRQTQPQGPYRLFGWSSGGVLAYEVAAQLLGQDQQIEFVGMLDSWVPGIIEQPVQTDDEMIMALSHNIVEYLAGQMRGTPVELPKQDHWQDYYHIGCREGYLPQAWTETYFHQMLIHQKDFLRAAYQPLPLPVHLDLIATQQSLAIDPLLGWSHILPSENIYCVTVPGTHYELMSAPYISDVGATISQVIARRTDFYRHNPNPAYQVADETPVMKLQNGKPGKPLAVCIPGAGDNVFSFVDFVQTMPSDWTVLAIQPRGLWGGGIPHSSVEAAASFYLDALRDQLGAHELHIVGHSFGGWIALSLVTQMEAQGISVKSLTIADSRVPMGTYHQEYSDLQALTRLIELFEMRGCSLGLTPTDLAPLSYHARLALTLSRLIDSGLLPKSTRNSDFEAIYRAFATHIRIWFTPDVLPKTPTTLVMAQGSSPERFVGWKTLMPEISVLQSLGNHMTLLKQPDVRLLTDTIQGKTAI